MQKMLAVLPFENLGPPEDEYFADGLTDALIAHLAKFGELGVISRASSMQYKGSSMSLREIGDELGASYVLTGTIHWDKSTTESRVLIYARLTQVNQRADMWVESYERVLDSVFEIQSDIARRVTAELSIAVQRSEQLAMATPPTQNLEAYDFFLRGRQYFSRSWDREDIDIATQMFSRAVQLDSSFALAWAWLSRGHESMYWEYYDRSEQRRLEAGQAALTSLDLDPDLAEAHLALGYCYYHCEQDYGKALDEFATALTIQPGNAETYAAIAPVQRRQGLLPEAAANFTRSLQLDPRSHLKAFDIGLTYGMMRQYDSASAYLNRTMLLAPDWPLPYVYKAWLQVISRGDVEAAREVIAASSGRADLSSSKYYWWLARVLDGDHARVLVRTRRGSDTAAYYLHCARMHRLMGHDDTVRIFADSARRVLEPLVARRESEPRFLSQLGLAYANLGRGAEGITVGRRAVELLPTSRDAFDAPFLVVNLAETLVILGDHDGAVDLLRSLLDIPGFVSPAYLRLDPLWRPLQEHPGFKQLIAGGASLSSSVNSMRERS